MCRAWGGATADDMLRGVACAVLASWCWACVVVVWKMEVWLAEGGS